MAINFDTYRKRAKQLDAEEKKKRDKEAQQRKSGLTTAQKSITAPSAITLKNIKTAPSTIKDERNIAPVMKTFEPKKTTVTAPERKSTAIAKVILGTVGDLGMNAASGAVGHIEGITDAVGYGAADVAEKFGKGSLADRIREKTKESFTQKLFGDAIKTYGEHSISGDFTDSVAQGIGQVGTSILGGALLGGLGLGTKAVSAITTAGTAMSGFGSGTGQAYEGGATDDEAKKYGMIAGASEALTELLFGGMGKVSKALGHSKGLLSLDDMLARKVSNIFSNQIMKNITEFGIKSSAEGFEEVLSGIAQAVGKKITYMKDEDFSKILKDENLLEQFLVGMTTSAIMQSGDLVKSTAGKTDFITGLDQNEQKVVDKAVENRIAEAEKGGKKLSRKDKDKIYNEVRKALDEGDIDTDVIESVLGGETYKKYKDTADNEAALKKEFDTLNKMKQGDMTGEQIDRRAELKEKLKALENSSNTSALKEQLSNEVSSLVKDSRLAESYNEKARRREAFTADLTKYDEKQQTVIKKAVESGILNNTRKTHRFVDFIAKISADKGVSFDFTSNEKLKESGFAIEGRTVNGLVTKDGIQINVNSAKALNTVVGHEITHILEGTELYSELQTMLKAVAESKGEYQSRYDEIAKLYEGVEGANIEQELTADLVGDYLFSDEDFIRRLSTENRSIFDKLRDEINYLCRIATAGSAEARKLEQAKKLFEKVYREAEAKINTADEGGVRYSFSEKSSGNDKVIIDSIKHNIALISKEEKFSVKSETLPENIKKSQYVFNIFVEQGGFAENSKIGLVELTNAGAKSTVFHGFGNEKLAAVRAIKSVIENGDIIQETPNYENNGVDRIIIAAKGTIDGSPAYVGVIIRRFYNKKTSRNSFYLHEAVIEKTDSPIMTGPQLSGNTVSESVSNNSIPNSTENVKQKDVFGFKINENADVDEDLLEELSIYHPDAEVDSEGNVTVYHRTSKANADKIRKTGIMTALEDALFFSSKSEGYASDYGDTVLTFKIPSTVLRVNDIFDGEVHFDVPLKRMNNQWSMNVSKYLVNTADSYSLSSKDTTPKKYGDYAVYGEDVMLEGKAKPTGKREFTAPTRESIAEGKQKAITDAPIREDKNLDYEFPMIDDVAPVSRKQIADMERESREAAETLTDADMPPQAEAPIYSADSIPLNKKTLKNVSDVGRKILMLNAKEKRSLTELIQRYSTSETTGEVKLDEEQKKIFGKDYENASKVELFYELKKFFGEKSFTERIEEVANVRQALSGYRIGVSSYIKNGISDYAEFRKRNFGKLLIANDGIPVDTAYMELSETYPDFFPSDIVNPTDQLLQMAEVANMERDITSTYEVDDDVIREATETIGDMVGSYQEKQLIKATEREGKVILRDEERKARREQSEADKARRQAEKEAEPTRSKLHKSIVDGIKAKFTEKGFDFDKVLSDAKNLSTFATVDNTPQRVMTKALGYKPGQILADETVNKVAQNESEGIKWLNSYLDRKSGVLAEISKKYKIKPGSKESAAAQMFAEGFYVNEKNEIIRYGEDELAKDFPDVTVRERIKGLARDEQIRKIYDETLDAINESRKRNLYPEIPRLDNYFLHFRAMDDTFSRLGLPFNPNDIRAKDLPTDLNGVTADLKPGQPYFASAMHREGKRTTFDLLGGLERYLTSAKNQIYHIDDIQTMRALRNYIADTFGQANGLGNLDSLTEEEAQERIEKVYGSHLSTFAKFLNEEANVLAGKTTLIDRGLEGIIGRRGISLLNTINGQVGSNMVGFNISSSLTNFLPVVQTMAKTNKGDFVKALAQTSANKLNSLKGKSDGFKENSPVIIRRKGAERFYRTPYQKIGDAGYILMSAVDDISTEIIARTKYNELTRKGMDSQKAHFETDKWVSQLMGDRSLGQMPQLYNSKMLGVVTKFQLEVRNQLDSMFYDTIQDTKISNEAIENKLLRNAKTAAKVATTFFELAVLQHVFGWAFEKVAGYNPAFDIVEVLIKTFGFDDDEDDEDTVMDNIEEGFFALLEDLPYTSTLTGGRIPISSALPLNELINGQDQYGNEKSRWETLRDAAPYYFLPTGFGQVKKTAKGLQMFDKDLPIAGSYTDSGNLRFPVDKTPVNVAQAAVFGQYANENARTYFDEGYAPLKEKQIQEFKNVGLPIADYWKIREGLSALKPEEGKTQVTLNQKGDYIGSIDLPTAKKNILINNIADRETPIDMKDYDKFPNFEVFDFAKKNPELYKVLQMEGISVKEYKEKYEKSVFMYTDDFAWAAQNPEAYTVSKAVTDNVTEYKKYTSELYKIRADKDSDGKSISGSAKRKKKAYIWSLDIDEGAKYILFRNAYKSDDTYNGAIINYLLSRNDISYEDKKTILTELDFKIDSKGRITWN